MSSFRNPQSAIRNGISRRDFARLAALGAFGTSTSGWLPALGRPRRRTIRKRTRSCILLWMPGGPSQIDTFDPKPGHANGGPFKAIETSVPGILISEHLPKLARQMQHLAILRSMSTKEGDHCAGHAQPAHRLRAGRSGPLSDAGLAVEQGAGRRRCRDAQLREHLVQPFAEPGAFRPRFPGAAARARWSSAPAATSAMQA